MADKSYKLTLSLSDGSTINAGTITAPQGPNGANGVTFTPSVSESGVLSWTNNGGLTNPSPISIKGPKGDDAVITESDVEGWGFTRNAGTITEIKMNGESKGINGVVDLGTVLIDASKFATSAQGTNADSALSKANTNATEISTIKTTYQTKTDTTLETTSKTVVGAINEVKGTAGSALSKANANATEISNIKDGTTKVKKAETADNATNVTTSINRKAITDIFETDGITAKKASKTAHTLTVSGNNGTTATTTTFDGSAATTLALNTTDFTASGGASNTIALKSTGVIAGEYTAIRIDEKGRATAGGKAFAFIEAGAAIPEDVMIGGIVFEAVE